MDGYIKLHRKILEWEWYRDINTKVLFIHLILSANIKDCRHMGKIVPRGCVLTTVSALSEATALTPREIRTALKRLILTKEIEVKTTNKNSVIKVHNYPLYQGCAPAERQTNDKQGANQRQTNDKPLIGEEEGKKEKKRNKEDTTVSSSPGAESAPGGNRGNPVISLELNDGSHHPVYQEDVNRWAQLYPAVNVLQELRNMVGWIEANPQKRKTKSGIKRFITGWLAKAQNRGGPAPVKTEKEWKTLE